MLRMIRKILGHKGGATAIEYGLIAALLSVGIITVLGTASTSLNGIYTTISTALSNASSTGTPPAGN